MMTIDHLLQKYLAEYHISDLQREQFEALPALYNNWNAKINVISRKDMYEFPVRHLLHSLGIAKVVRFPTGSIVLDIGTGGGFPGIPLAILFPDVTFHLIDSIGKKIKVVQAVVKDLGLQNVVVKQMRVENFSDKVDFVVSRAVTRMKTFTEWVKGKILKADQRVPRGIYYLKGGDLKEELKETGKPYKLHQLSEYFDQDFFETKQVVYLASK